jgi:membrane fusion protein, multidrug efflux system
MKPSRERSLHPAPWKSQAPKGRARCPQRCLFSVAQVSNLLYRRLPVGRARLAALQLACILTFVVFLSGCGKSGEGAKPPPPSVTVSRPAQEPVEDSVDLTGTVAAFRTVDLVARVTGYLQSIHFQDGARVEAGQLLFVIEPEPYQQQLALAQASLERARSEYERQLGLLKENATSTANVEKWLSERDQAAAQVELAKLNLSYTRVTAPFPGRIGRHLVDVGNLVGPGVNTKLASLDQLVPIYINFNLNEREALRLRELMRQQGLQPGSNVGKAPVLLGLQNQEGYPYAATLDFVDTGVSSTSGTILLRASYTNTDQVLIPGLFARVRIPLGPPQPMLVLPASALANDQEGDYVLVADATNTVIRRTVVKGPQTRSGCAIRSGLSAEDRVIIRGLMQARPGSKITPVSEAAPGQPSPNS